jgi:hypothetical protein
MAFVVVAVRLAQHYVPQERRQDPTPHHTRAGSQYIPHGVNDAAFARAGHARQAATRAAWPAWLKTLLDCYKRRTKYSQETQDKVARVLLACELLPGLLDFHAWKRAMAPQVGELIKDENRSESDGIWASPPLVVVCVGIHRRPPRPTFNPSRSGTILDVDLDLEYERARHRHFQDTRAYKRHEGQWCRHASPPAYGFGQDSSLPTGLPSLCALHQPFHRWRIASLRSAKVARSPPLLNLLGMCLRGSRGVYGDACRSGSMRHIPRPWAHTLATT